MADILTFPDKITAEREALIAQARSNYETIFPAETTTSVLGALGPGQSASLSAVDLPDIRSRNRARLDTIKRRDNFKFRDSGGVRDICDDLVMDHADPGMPSDSPYRAPESDPA